MAMCTGKVAITIEPPSMHLPLRTVIALFASFSTMALTAQKADSSTTENIRFSGFVDVYYAYDLGHPGDDERPRFLYQYDRHNEVDLNLGLIRADHEKERVRAALGLMAGTYAQANLINEPELLRNVYEARVGVKLSRKHDVWLDAGVFPSHIGMETAIGIENWTLTRSVVAENSPYYLSGAKLSWKPNGRLELAGLFMNGWQRLRRIQDDTPCFGTQVLWTIKSGMKLNWSTFLGSDTPDSIGTYRVFNNFWWTWEGERWGGQAGADIGVQQNAAGRWDEWMGGVAILRRKLNETWRLVARTEYYNDDHQVILFTGTPHGLTTMGYSLGADLLVGPDALVRFECRTFHGVDAIFESVHGPVRDNTSFTLSMAARF